jgi:cytidine deaminase
VLTDDGEVIPGSNVENASYPLSMCAERTAVQRAAAEGFRSLAAVAVASSGDGLTWPCGGCRQVLHEFGPEMLVIVEGAGGGQAERMLPELLPEAFGPSDLP